MTRAVLALALLAGTLTAVACSDDDTTPAASAPDASTGAKADSGGTPGADSGTPKTDDAGNPTTNGDDSGDGNPVPDSGTPDATVSPPGLGFSSDVYDPIIGKKCLGCHAVKSDGGIGSGIAFGHLDLGTGPTAYAKLLGDGGGAPAAGAACASLGANGLRLVVPGAPDTSLLYNKLASNDGDGGILPLADGGSSIFCGNPMPLHFAAIATTDLATIHDWIAQGANP